MTQPITTDHLQQPLLVIRTAVTDGQSTVSDCQSINQSIPTKFLEWPEWHGHRKDCDQGKREGEMGRAPSLQPGVASTQDSCEIAQQRKWS